MVDATVRYGVDTWAGSGKPNANHNASGVLKLWGGIADAFLFLKSPVPHGYTVQSATLQLTVYRTADWTGTKNLTAKRIAASWKAGALTWNNMPGIAGTGATCAVTGGTDGQVISFDVTAHLQSIANGSTDYGWRIETDSSTAHWFYGFSSQNPPQLLVTYADIPSTPTDLSPQGGAVSVAAPYLSFSATDHAHPGDIASIQVQVDPAASTTAPAFDSGEVVTTVPELNLASTTYAGLASGSSTQWRARFKNSAGNWSPYSPWVTFNRVAKGTVTITNPAASPNNYVTEGTPPILWSFSGTQKVWQVRIVDQADHTNILADSGKVGTSDTSWTVPKNTIHDDGTYTAIVRVWDDQDRVATAGDPRFANALQDFTFQQDATVTAPAGLTAAQDGMSPWVVLSWTRATAPDSFTISRDGKNIAYDVDPADVIVSAGNYSWRDPQASPMELHTYGVRAVVNGKASAKSNIASITASPEGVWVIDSSHQDAFVLEGSSIDAWKRTDQSQTLEVIGGGKIIIKTGKSGVEGSYSGKLAGVPGYSIATMRASLDAIDGRNATVQLIAANLTIPVQLINLTRIPHPETVPANPSDLVSFDFIQVD